MVVILYRLLKMLCLREENVMVLNINMIRDFKVIFYKDVCDKNF